MGIRAACIILACVGGIANILSLVAISLLLGSASPEAVSSIEAATRPWPSEEATAFIVLSPGHRQQLQYLLLEGTIHVRGLYQLFKQGNSWQNPSFHQDSSL